MQGIRHRARKVVQRLLDGGLLGCIPAVDGIFAIRRFQRIHADFGVVQSLLHTGNGSLGSLVCIIVVHATYGILHQFFNSLIDFVNIGRIIGLINRIGFIVFLDLSFESVNKALDCVDSFLETFGHAFECGHFVQAILQILQLDLRIRISTLQILSFLDILCFQSGDLCFGHVKRISISYQVLCSIRMVFGGTVQTLHTQNVHVLLIQFRLGLLTNRFVHIGKLF